MLGQTMQFKVRIAPDKEGDYVVSCPGLKLSAPVSGDFETMIDQALEAIRAIVTAETRSRAMQVGAGAVALSFTVGASAPPNRTLDEFHEAVRIAQEEERVALGKAVQRVGEKPFKEQVLDLVTEAAAEIDAEMRKVDPSVSISVEEHVPIGEVR